MSFWLLVDFSACSKFPSKLALSALAGCVCIIVLVCQQKWSHLLGSFEKSTVSVPCLLVSLSQL